ncbi:hypothetical protein BKA64DRAFT_633902 [Cadophora sp. MPI-SDFR-AT-0126]|nr:hypothetical protein BKA64DRAFT_633902 [Leotiomycetes sp. MPI-SDFR-AT-0126]
MEAIPFWISESLEALVLPSGGVKSTKSSSVPSHHLPHEERSLDARFFPCSILLVLSVVLNTSLFALVKPSNATLTVQIGAERMQTKVKVRLPESSSFSDIKNDQAANFQKRIINWPSLTVLPRLRHGMLVGLELGKGRQAKRHKNLTIKSFMSCTTFPASFRGSGTVKQAGGRSEGTVKSGQTDQRCGDRRRLLEETRHKSDETFTAFHQTGDALLIVNVEGHLTAFCMTTLLLERIAEVIWSDMTGQKKPNGEQCKAGRAAEKLVGWLAGWALSCLRYRAASSQECRVVIDCVGTVHPVRDGDDYAVQLDSLDNLLWKVESTSPTVPLASTHHRLNFTSLQTQSRLGQGSPGGSSVESHTRTRASGYYFESFTHPRVSVVVEWLTGYGDHNQPQGQYPKCPMPSPPRFCWDPDLTDSGWVVWVLLYGFDFACVLI